MKKWTQSVEDATLAINNDRKFVKAYLRRAKSFMELGKFEDAVRDYEHLHYTDRSNYEYRQLLSQAKLELKKSKQKDYYKILGVGKNANEEEIKKAYKKRALEHHPGKKNDNKCIVHYEIIIYTIKLDGKQKDYYLVLTVQGPDVRIFSYHFRSTCRRF